MVKKKNGKLKIGKHEPKVRIPLTFDQAVGGLLAVKPKEPKRKEAAGKKCQT